MIKVVLIILFIIVGLIYDWGGIKNHPGPVRPLSCCSSSGSADHGRCHRVLPISTMAKPSLAVFRHSPRRLCGRSTPTVALSSFHLQLESPHNPTKPYLARSKPHSSA